MAKGSLLASVVLGLCLILFAVGTVASENPPQWEVPDAFMLFSQFSDVVAVKDVNRNPMFKCLRTIRTEYDTETPSATYDWSLNAGEDKPRKHASVQYTSGDAPASFFTTVDSDPSTREEARFLYADFKTCGVTVIESFGYQCTLWVAYENRYSYPECRDGMNADLCGESVSLSDKGLCNDTETD
ncbi:uncharacterized protein LOC119395835 [Rhipicephalus sanguineus]|uniref:uncharacterized protein LOC119395835 n=1 Tax=Rhipicephalus sanguineus TaxID=34632 RepID=UPI001893475F|nr:uncharacterized protein LOC119395835 [Rhipicephalus sanguineus]